MTMKRRWNWVRELATARAGRRRSAHVHSCTVVPCPCTCRRSPPGRRLAKDVATEEGKAAVASRPKAASEQAATSTTTAATAAAAAATAWAAWAATRLPHGASRGWTETGPIHASTGAAVVPGNKGKGKGKGKGKRGGKGGKRKGRDFSDYHNGANGEDFGVFYGDAPGR